MICMRVASGNTHFDNDSIIDTLAPVNDIVIDTLAPVSARALHQIISRIIGRMSACLMDQFTPGS
jgi:hypothetical protein